MKDDAIAEIREILLSRAAVFDHPWDYRAGVEDALSAVDDLLTGRRTVIDLQQHDTPAPARML